MNQNTSKIKTIKRVLGSLVRIGPRIKPRLKPVHDITGSNVGNTGSWTSIGDDPQFDCQLQHLELHTGWYMISLEIECENVFDIAKIYVDVGQGHLEADCVKIPFHSRKIAKRVVRFTRQTRGIRFDPLNSPGNFTVHEFKITPITYGFAESRMLRKLTRWSPVVHNDTVAGARNVLKTQASETGENYRKLLERNYTALFNWPVKNKNYLEWIEKIESSMAPAETDIFDLNQTLGRPLISVIMPTYNTNPQLLSDTIESVVKQSYSNLQLCISDDGSTSEKTLDSIKQWQKKDGRITATFRDKSGGIAENTNSALALANGDYCVFLDHDDLLSKHALYEISKCIVDQPDLMFLYSDEDKIDDTGVRVEPHFKPDWNPDLLLAQNYICHLVAIQRKLLVSIGGCRLGYDGAQDHDLLLRVMERVGDDQVRHIQKVLYHWRMSLDSTATTSDAKTYSTDSGLAAIDDYLARSGVSATTGKGKYPNTYRVVWDIPDNAPMVSIIIPTRDRLGILSQCIDSVLELTDYPNYEIIVVNNASSEPETLRYFEEIQSVRNIKANIRVLNYDGEFNYSAINNFAVDQAAGSVITMMNNDIEVINRDWLREMVSHACRREIGCVGAKLLYKNNMVQHAGVILGIGGVAGHAHKYFDSESAGYFSRLQLTQNLSAVTAACLTVEKEIYQRVGGFNDSELKVAFNDVDFCLKVGAEGLRNIWTPYALLYHHESISRGHEDTHEKKMRFNREVQYMQEQWGDLLNSDPAYNRNLTLAREDFSLAA